MYNKLRGFFAENGIKHKEVADLIGINPDTFSRKLKGEVAFSIDQMKTICSHYNISADAYFFEERVS